MSMYDSGSDSLMSAIEQQQIAVVTQLLKVAPTMYSFDELFQWLAYALVHQFDLQVAQFWTPLINSNGIQSLNLRMMVAKDPSMPEQIIVNDQVLLVARRFAHEQCTLSTQPVEILFPTYHAAVLKRYSLNFCAVRFIKGNVLLPPQNTLSSHSKEPIPFSLTVLLFLMRQAHRGLLPAITAILQQAVGLATSRGLPISTLPTFPAMQPQQESSPMLSAFIPRRIEGSDLMVSHNPFARTAFIDDKKALRLHTAIDLLDVQHFMIPLYSELFDSSGDISRLLGFLTLLAAVLGG